MDFAELAVVLCVVTLAVTCVFLSFRLVNANKQLGEFASKAFEHALAHDIDQREYMRSRLEMEQAELLLREKREAAVVSRPVRRRDNGNDFEVALDNGVVG